MAEGRTISVILLVTTALVLVSALFGRQGARHLGRLRAERQQVADATFALLRSNAQLRDDIQRLRHDERLLEQLARRQLGLVRPGELVFRFGR
jgi:cell division protein FtsB